MHCRQLRSAFIISRKQNEEKTCFYLINYTDQPQNITVTVSASEISEIWDTWTGAVTKAKVLHHDEKQGIYELALQLPKSYGIFLVTDSVQEKGIRK